MTAELATYPHEAKLPAGVSDLAAEISADGGAVLAAYQEPVGKRWQLFAMLPPALVKPTPFQRDLSPAHLKHLTEVMKRLDRFTDPILVVKSGAEYWTPNGNHRRAGAVKLGAKMLPAIVIVEPDAAYQILALNTEKAHNLKDKSLEVIRMFRARLETDPRSAEKDFAFEFERAHYITFGLLYEQMPRFGGGAYAPILSRVDGFLAKPLRDAIEERDERAAQLRRADEMVAEVVAKAKKRGLTHPYLRNFIVGRVNPLTRARKTLPSYKTALGSVIKSLEEFDLGKIHFGQVSSAAQMAAAAAVESS